VFRGRRDSAQDYDFLYEAGVKGIYGPGTPIPASAKDVLEQIRKALGKGDFRRRMSVQPWAWFTGARPCAASACMAKAITLLESTRPTTVRRPTRC
jgi:selenocysteine lyase/cysteine desulfurase